MFFGWRVVAAAFVVALFAWGIGFYGPPVFLQTLHAERGWPIPLVSAAITCQFVLGATVISNLARLHERFGVPAVTRAGAVLTATGLIGWGSARTPWQLLAATVPSGLGWALTSGAALNAMVAPWFDRRRPAALSLAYNGASVAGVVFTPLWVALITAVGLAEATALVAVVMVVAMWFLAGRYLGRTPEEFGVAPDGGPALAPDRVRPHPAMPLPQRAPWRDPRFSTLAVAASLSLFAQIGLIAHLFSSLVPVLGSAVSGGALALATGCAIVGRSVLGVMLKPGIDRNAAAAANVTLQAAGSAALVLGYGHGTPLLISGCILFGLGLGNVASLPALIAQSNFAPADVPRVVALVTAVSQAIYAFAPIAFGALRSWSAADGTRLLFAAVAAIQLAAALVFLAGCNRRRRSTIRAPITPGSAMLQLRPNCECCDRDLPPASYEAMICSYECTFCHDCAVTRFAGRCPNCGGELVRRPVRPAERLRLHPSSTERVLKPHPECAPIAG